MPASDVQGWYSPTLGRLSVLIDRELQGTGWVGDMSGWRPEAQLKGVHAWQDSLADAMSGYARAHSEQAVWDSAPDRDLVSAARLLEVREQGMSARLSAAREALQRYDGRLGHGLAARVDARHRLLTDTSLMVRWGDVSSSQLTDALSQTRVVFGDRQAVEAFYAARARAQVASVVLDGYAWSHPELMADPVIASAHDDALVAWRRVASYAPLFVRNGEAEGAMPSNDVEILAVRTRQAVRATQRLARSLADRPASRFAPDAIAVSANTGVLPSP